MQKRATSLFAPLELDGLFWFSLIWKTPTRLRRAPDWRPPIERGEAVQVPAHSRGFELPDPQRSRALLAELFWVWLPTGLLVAAMTDHRYLRGARAVTSSRA